MDYVDKMFDECLFKMHMLKEKATCGLDRETTMSVFTYMKPIRDALFRLTFNKLSEMEDGIFKAEYALLRLANISTSSMYRKDNFINGKSGTHKKDIIEPLAEKINDILVDISVNIAIRYIIDVEELLDMNLLNIQKQ